MALLKLSQIASAPATPATTDTVVGVGSGTTDYQYSIAQLQAAFFPLATSNITWYVNGATGSDSNSGLAPGIAFKTIQKAMLVAAGYNWNFKYGPTINVAAGTYVQSGTQLVAATLFNAGNAGGKLIGAGYATTTIQDDGTAFGGFIVTGNTTWTISELTFDSATYCIFAIRGAVIEFKDNIGLTDSTHAGTEYLNCFDGAQLVMTNNVTLHLGDTAYLAFYLGGGNEARLTMQNATVVLPAVNHGASSIWIDSEGSGTQYCFLLGNTYTNKANFLGAAVGAAGVGFLQIASDNGKISDVPGVATPAGSDFDTGLLLTNLIGGSTSGRTCSGPRTTTAPPTTSFVSNDPSWIVGKDTTNGIRYIAFNDGGVIYVKQISRTLNTQTANYTLQLLDQDGRVEMNLAGANTLTVPTNATVAFPIGVEIRVTQIGAGATTITAAGGVTGHNFGALSQWASVVLYKRGTDEWVQTTV